MPSAMPAQNLTISAVWQKIFEFSNDGVINGLTQYGETLTDISIPSKIDGVNIVGIGASAFYNCDSLKSITIPNSVTSIGDKSFDNCNKLVSISMPNNVTSIGWDVFGECYSLQFNIKDGLKYLGNNENKYLYLAGVEDVNVNSISIDNNCKFIGSYAFYDYTSLKSIEIPNGVVSIGGRAFYGCTSLESVIIPNSVTSIGNGAFSHCGSLKYNIKDGLKYLGNNENKYLYLAGVEDYSIKTANIDSNCKIIGYDAFSDCRLLTSIVIPNSVINVGDNLFDGCISLNYNVKDGLAYLGNSENEFLYLLGAVDYSITTANIDSNCRFIGDKAFGGFSSLESIVIPNSVTSIGNYAFQYCSSLTSITIPNSVTSIGQWAFIYCESLTIYCEVESQPTDWIEVWNGNCPVVWGYKDN